MIPVVKHGSTKVRLYLTNLIKIYNEMTNLIDERRAEVSPYLHFRSPIISSYTSC